MDRNSVVGLLLIAAILVGYMVFSKPSQQELEAARRKADSIAMLKQEETIKKSVQVQQNVQSTGLSHGDSLKTQETNVTNLKNQYGNFAVNAQGENQFYTIENDVVKMVVSAKGGRPYSVELKKYKTYDKKSLLLFKGDSTQFGLNFYAQNKPISTNDLYFKPEGYSEPIILSRNDTAKSLVMRLYAANNKYIEYVYTLKPGSYMTGLSINLVNMDSIIATNTSGIDLKWLEYAPVLERSWDGESGYTTIFFKHLADEVEKFKNSKEEESKDISTRVKWIAFKQQFFSSVIIANDYFANASMKTTKEAVNSPYLKVMQAQVGLPYERKQYQHIALSVYYGPNHYNTLKKYKMDLEELVSLGSWIIKWINRYLIIPVFNFLNQYITNYGIIILLLTIFIKLILTPLTYKSYMSMAKMRLLKPQIDEINERIPADKAMERQQATMGLYKRAGVNPLGGCLPLLLQMPILIAMFRFFPTSIELRQQGFLWATDLSSYDSIFSWSTQIPLLSSFYGNHISLFTILMTVTTIITTKMSNQASASSTQMPGMQSMMYIMPIMFMFILNRFSAGLTYYYFLVNVLTIIQNEVMKRAIDEDKLMLEISENKKKVVKKSKFQERLEQAAKQRGYKLPKK